MSKFDKMGKEDLRAACRAAGISYGKLNNDGMRSALSEMNEMIEVATKASVKEATAKDSTPEKAVVSKVEKTPVKLEEGCPLCKADPSSQTWATEDETCLCHHCGKTYSMATGKEVGIRKIEKDREERNGIKRPSVGSLCRAVWDALDAIGTSASAKDVKALAEENEWNQNNASIEFYQWRKFNGIEGRQKKAK